MLFFKKNDQIRYRIYEKLAVMKDKNGKQKYLDLDHDLAKHVICNYLSSAIILQLLQHYIKHIVVITAQCCNYDTGIIYSTVL